MVAPAQERSAADGLKKAEPELAARFLRLVQELVWELHPHMRRMVAIELDSDLDRDLGLDSLGRAELVLQDRPGLQGSSARPPHRRGQYAR